MYVIRLHQINGLIRVLNRIEISINQWKREETQIDYGKMLSDSNPLLT